MGILLSCQCVDFENALLLLESFIVKSIGFGSISFGKSILERSISFRDEQLNNRISRDPASKDASSVGKSSIQSRSLHYDGETDTNSVILDPSNPKHQAALKLQKVYKSFRTRRKLADCAVLVEQSWWKLLDFAELKHSSISFFDIKKHETAISRWSRARTRAAKVGKGLSKNDKARKLALQHWLEAIDPRHRYGHNLHFYYVNWLHSKSREPFFYWLDIGEGKEVNLEKSPRFKLQQQCIKYLGPMERKCYAVVVEQGKFIFENTGEFVHTTSDAKWIFVLSTSKTLYVGKKKKGTFQHSSFLAGGVTIAAGRLIVESGNLKAVWPHSGHYRPTEQNFKDFLSFLEENNVDLTDVQTTPVDEENGLNKPKSSRHARNHSSEEDYMQIFNDFENADINAENVSLHRSKSGQDNCYSALEEQNQVCLHDSSRTQTILETMKQNESFKCSEIENLTAKPSGSDISARPTLAGGYVSADEKVPSERLSEENEVENITEEAILQRINSKKGTDSYQLGRQLSFKWTTGAGPRIGCVRDYPLELQFRVLEQVNLSPRRMAQ